MAFNMSMENCAFHYFYYIHDVYLFSVQVSCDVNNLYHLFLIRFSS